MLSRCHDPDPPASRDPTSTTALHRTRCRVENGDKAQRSWLGPIYRPSWKPLPHARRRYLILPHLRPAPPKVPGLSRKGSGGMHHFRRLAPPGPITSPLIDHCRLRFPRTHYGTHTLRLPRINCAMCLRAVAPAVIGSELSTQARTEAQRQLLQMTFPWPCRSARPP